MHLTVGDVVDWSFHGGGGWGDALDVGASRPPNVGYRHVFRAEAWR
jgi:hypothetical protein